jgi:hypothetical protein
VPLRLGKPEGRLDQTLLNAMPGLTKIIPEKPTDLTEVDELADFFIFISLLCITPNYNPTLFPFTQDVSERFWFEFVKLSAHECRPSKGKSLIPDSEHQE